MISGGTPSMQKSEYWEGNIPFISAASMHDTFISSSSQCITEKGLKNGSKFLAKGNLLLLVRGSMLWKQIPVCYNNVDVAFNQDVKGLIVNNKSTSLFMLYWFQAKESLLKYMVTGTGIGAGKLDSDDLSSLPTIIANQYEQSKISSFFSLLEERIQTQNKIIEKYESLIQGLNNNMFCQNKDAIPKLRFPGFSGNWNDTIIGKILKIGSGRDYKHLNRGPVPVMGTGGYMTSVDDHLYEGESVCIGRKGTINSPFFLSGKFWTVDTLFYTHSFKNVLPRFCFYNFNHINWLKYNEASGVPSLSKTTIESIHVSIPSISEQEKIAKFLTFISDKIELEKSVLLTYQKQKNYLLKNLFV